jgi:CelD/BcsL family acetyltransferase involved in cellulose biosynthesis
MLDTVDAHFKASIPAARVEQNKDLSSAIIHPLMDSRWHEFVSANQSAEVFHQSAWLEAVTDAFGYESRVYVLEDSNARIVAAWPTMLVKSRLTGRRLVCLPFCHRAGPLLSTPEHGTRLLRAVVEDAKELGARSIETRAWPAGLAPPYEIKASTSYSRHVLDLSGGPEAVLAGADKDIRYSIRRAQRDGVTIRLADGDADIEAFYHLYLGQRRRQGLLPQPKHFIREIYHRLIQSGSGFAVMAEYQGRPICGLISVGHGQTVVGTHSAADQAARQLRATSLAMWKCVEIACERGYSQYDFGRTDTESAGLEQFKTAWGAHREELPYYYYPRPGGVNAGAPHGLAKSALRLYSHYAPEPIFAGLSNVIYRHLG